jgi:hypothetical protein
MADVITGLADTHIDTEWRHEKASQVADDDATDPQDQADGGDADGTDSDGDSGDGTDGDADGTDS